MKKAPVFGWDKKVTVRGVRVVLPADRAPAKDHFVLGQGARLVGEDELDLAEVLRYVEGAADHGRVGLLVI